MRAHLGCQTDNLSPAFHAQVSTNHATYPRSQHLPLVVQKHRSIVIEANQTAVRSPDNLLCTDNDGTTYIPSSDLGGRCGGCCIDWACSLDDAHDFVADTAPAVVDFLLEYVDALYEQRAGIIYDLAEFYIGLNIVTSDIILTLSVPLRPIIPGPVVTEW